jgi:hypothetical protein
MHGTPLAAAVCHIRHLAGPSPDGDGELLRQRLTRRGVALSAVLLADAARASVPAALVGAAARGAALFAAGTAPASAPAVLAETALRALAGTKLKAGAALLLGPALREALRGKTSAEVAQRLRRLIDATEGWPAERLREWRALEVLEQMGTPEASRLLEELAKGVPTARQTVAAKAALARMAKE